MKLRKGRIFAVLLGLFGLLLIGGSIFYTCYTSPIDASSQADIEVVIPSGMSTENISKLLEKRGLVRNASIFRLYLKLNHISNLKADTYLFRKSMSTKKIASMLEEGSNYNPNLVMITFQEGKNMKQYAKILAEKTNIKEEDFLLKMQDRTYIATLFPKYWFLQDTILQDEIYYPLEGYLAPDTYQFDKKDVTIEEVVTTLLNQTEKNLEPYQKTLQETGNVHEVLTLASLAELEGKKKEDRAKIVGVFQNRLQAGMNLGSDVTTYYAFQQEMTADLTTAMFNTYNPYNTRSLEMKGRLPVGPICNPSSSSLAASISPTPSDYFYFVADKHGNVFYTKTVQEHEQKVQEIKDKGDWIW